MRLTAPLDDVLVTRSHLRVLRALDALPVGVPASGRQLARRAGVSHTAASRALSGLADEGVVLARPYGRADYYELNREHVLYEGLRALFKRETGLKNDLIEFLSREIRRRLPRVRRAYIFGSAARDDMHKGSDIDLAVIASGRDQERVEAEVAGIEAEVRRRFGGRLNTIIATGPIGKLTQPRRPGRELWRRIEREGVPLLSGTEH